MIFKWLLYLKKVNLHFQWNYFNANLSHQTLFQNCQWFWHIINFKRCTFSFIHRFHIYKKKHQKVLNSSLAHKTFLIYSTPIQILYINYVIRFWSNCLKSINVVYPSSNIPIMYSNINIYECNACAGLLLFHCMNMFSLLKIYTTLIKIQPNIFI